ncbi:MAG: amidophosphoribosyltransferase [Acidobacteriota bacterium]
MSGFFGVVADGDCVEDLFYGTDYHSHLGTRRAGIAVAGESGIQRVIHDITDSPFRSKFQDERRAMKGRVGIGVISDYEDQPLIIGSHLGLYAIVTIGAIKNTDELVSKAFAHRNVHFSEMSGGELNATELIATLINAEASFEEGIAKAQEAIKGSCSLLLLTERGIYAARDRFGKTPVIIGHKSGAYAATFESSAFPNLGYEVERELGPGEVVLISHKGVERRVAPGNLTSICAFLWIYYGYPSSTYEGVNVEETRNRCGATLARRDDVSVDIVAGIPDSGVGHAIGYASESGMPYRRPFVKYTPTWPRSFMPPVQATRDLVAKMKLIPVQAVIIGKRLLFCEDSIVRGTQLKDTIRRLYEYGAKEVHMRPACPPLVFGCPFLNFSRSRSELDLAARRAIKELEGQDVVRLDEYTAEGSEAYQAMVDRIATRLGVTSLRYQRLADMIEAIGLPREKLCTFCWTGCDPSGQFAGLQRQTCSEKHA